MEKEGTRYKYRINEIFAQTAGKLTDKDAHLAEKVGKSRHYINAVRRYRIDSPNSITTDLLIKIAAALGVKPEVLLNYEAAQAA